jgi:hypothetical protein
VQASDVWGFSCASLPADHLRLFSLVRPHKDHRGVDLISDALPFGRLWYGEPNAVSNAIDYAKFFSRSHNAVIRVYDEAGNVIETHEHTGDLKEPYRLSPFRRIPLPKCRIIRHNSLCAAFEIAFPCEGQEIDCRIGA